MSDTQREIDRADGEAPTVHPVFRATLVRIVDADTLVLRLDRFMGDESLKTCRLLGVDAPERYTEAGKEATAFVTEWFFSPGGLVVRGEKPDKYGRLLVEVWRGRDGANLKYDLMAAGFGYAISMASQLPTSDRRNL